jgi:hypothetical protein
MVNRGARPWGSRLCAAVLAAFLVTALLGACSSPDPHRYSEVNAVADELKLSSIGAVILEERYGTGNFSDDAPTLRIVIAGPDAYDRIQQALTAASFANIGTTTWKGAAGHNDPIRAFLAKLNPGDTYYVFGEKKSRTVDVVGAVILITSLTGGVEDALLTAGATPLAGITGPGNALAGEPVLFSAAGTRDDPYDPVVSYDWGFGTAGDSSTNDATTTTSRASWTFAEPGVYTVTVRVHTRSGLTALATTKLKVTSPAATAPEGPQGLAAVAGDGKVTLTWSAGSGAPTTFYEVLDGSGQLVDAFSPFGGDNPVTWTKAGLTNGVAQTFQVVAVNEAGLSVAAGPVTVTPTASTPAATAGPAVAAAPTSS